jgi:RNA recognition motif-containing protein
MSIRLYIGNLPKEEIDRQDLQAVFAEEGDAVTTKLIKDRKTGKCRGFGFLTVNNDEQADQIIEKYNGQMFKDTPIKLEKALPRTKGEEGEEQQQQAPKPVIQGSGTPSPSTNKEGTRRDRNKKSRRGGGGTRDNSTNFDKMLAAQTTN